MRYIYIYNEVSRASEYGIGTYLRQMVKNLKHLDNSILVIVNSRSNCNEFEIKEKDGYIIYNIPSPDVFIKSFDNKYYRNIAYIIMSILPDSSCNEILFCFNYIQAVCPRPIATAEVSESTGSPAQTLRLRTARLLRPLWLNS